MPRAGAYAAYAQRALAACLVAAAFVSAARAHDAVASSQTKWGEELTRRSTASTPSSAGETDRQNAPFVP